MAIYDNDGTANYEIDKLYDNDGTANHQIGAVYDNDGTANSLIYTAQQTVTVAASSSTPSALYTNTWQNIPVSGYSSVSVTVVVGGTQDIFWGGIATSEVTHSSASGSPANAVYNIKSTNGNAAGTHTTTLALDPTATYYVYVGVYTGNRSNNGSMTVTAVFS